MTAPSWPRNDEARGQAGIVKGQGEANGADCADSAAERKRFEKLRALLAMKGHELYATDSGIFIVRRWGHTRDLRDLQAVEAFARQVGAA